MTSRPNTPDDRKDRFVLDDIAGVTWEDGDPEGWNPSDPDDDEPAE